MKEQLNFIFETPKKQEKHHQHNLSTDISHNRHVASTTLKKHKKIFPSKCKNELTEKNIFNIFHASFQEQEISGYQVFQLDFCECGNPQEICQIIRDTFLGNLVLKDMKEEYDQVLAECSQNPLKSTKITRKTNLFRTLSKTYPQIFLSQINNILTVLPSNLTPSQFQCLCWIQYHAHFQYLTYFLFTEIKKSFNSYERFKVKVDYELVDRTLFGMELAFERKGFGKLFGHFLRNYYESVGAALVPMTAYAQFLKIMYKQGHSILAKLLKIFLSQKLPEFQKSLVFLGEGDNRGYRDYLRQLDWQQIFLGLTEPEDEE